LIDQYNNHGIAIYCKVSYHCHHGTISIDCEAIECISSNCFKEADRLYSAK